MEGNYPYGSAPHGKAHLIVQNVYDDTDFFTWVFNLLGHIHDHPLASLRINNPPEAPFDFLVGYFSRNRLLFHCFSFMEK